MGFFTGLDAEGYDRQYTDQELVKRIMDYFQPYIRQMILVVIMLLIVAMAGAASPVIVSKGVDELKLGESFTTVFILIMAVFFAGVITWISNWQGRRLIIRIIADIVLKLRTDAFRASSEHDLSFYDLFATGKVVSRITSDTRDFGQMVVLITDILSQLVQALILAGILVSIDWRLSLVLFGTMPFIFLAALGFRRLARDVTRNGMRAMANVNAMIKETISGISVAKNFRQERSIYDIFLDANQKSFRVNVQRGLVLSMVFPLLNALGGVATGILVYVGGLSAVQGILTAGSWFLFIQSLDRFLFPVSELSAFWAQVQQGLASAERVFALIDAESKVIQVANNLVPDLKGDIRFENLWFEYTSRETVLCDFNLHIKPGETIALVGHTGAGKSSIAKLIARFYEFQRGKLLIDGRDIRGFDLDSYRTQLGIVSQTPFLFSGTVAENICYACPDSSMLSKIQTIATQIGDGEWLASLPDGLDTQVGERGGRLSMGQRQLVALMRVLIQEPAIFILDEATASVDPFTEWQIQQALNMILTNSTSILIAHRLSTVKSADRIVVLENGVIIEEGDHDALLASKGHYATLYNTYFRHQSLAYVEEARKFVEMDDL
jgi:ATP-binding cassette, subfamily B, bacterial